MLIPINYIRVKVMVSVSQRKNSKPKNYIAFCNIVYKEIEEDINNNKIAVSRIKKELKLNENSNIKVINIEILKHIGDGINEKAKY